MCRLATVVSESLTTVASFVLIVKEDSNQRVLRVFMFS